MAPVIVDGRELFAVRGVSALPAEERAETIRGRILQAARDPEFNPADIELRQVEDGVEIWGDGLLLRGVYDVDARAEAVEASILARTVRARIVGAIEAYRAGRTPEGVRVALRRAAIETAVLLGALAAIVALERLSARLIHRYVDGRVAHWERMARDVVALRGIWMGVRRALRLVFIGLGVVALALFLNAILLTLPWTRDVGFRLARVVAEPIGEVMRGVAASIPNLIALAIIVVLTLFVLRVVRRLFDAVGAGRLRLGRFEPEWAQPTSRIARIAIGLLGLVMAYPYIPGSSSEAFKAISIFAGVVLSLGATSLIANALAGNTLIYRRAFKVGDRIEVAGVFGDVEAVTSQATYIRTLKNERVTVPNSIVLGNQVTNYSQLAHGGGLILHSEVGIGYETPWREVEAMLLDAAHRTEGTLADPAPFVLQKRLGDYAPVYEINVYTRDEKAMPLTYTRLHANIQDVFAERGVQIMTPSYVADPPEAKVPPLPAAREAG